MSSGAWFQIDDPERESIARRVGERLAERVDRGLVDREEIASVANRRLPSLAPGEGPTFEAFRRMCLVWELDRPFPIQSHRRFVGPMIVAAKRVVSRMLRFHTDPPLVRQREFNRNLLVVLGTMLRRERDDSLR